jgi:putative hydrolase
MIALTDHGPSLPGAPHEFYFYRVPDLPKVINGVEVLSGVEANILDPNGTLDVPVKVLGPGYRHK